MCLAVQTPRHLLAARRRERRELLRKEADLMGHEVLEENLHPVEGQTIVLSTGGGAADGATGGTSFG